MIICIEIMKIIGSNSIKAKKVLKSNSGKKMMVTTTDINAANRENST